MAAAASGPLHTPRRATPHALRPTRPTRSTALVPHSSRAPRPNTPCPTARLAQPLILLHQVKSKPEPFARSRASLWCCWCLALALAPCQAIRILPLPTPCTPAPSCRWPGSPRPCRYPTRATSLVKLTSLHSGRHATVPSGASGPTTHPAVVAISNRPRGPEPPTNRKPLASPA